VQNVVLVNSLFQLHQTAEAFLGSFNYEECVKNMNALSKTLSPSCEHYIGPSSIHESISITKFPISNKDVEERLAQLLKFLKSYYLEIKDITVHEIQRKADVQAVHNVTMKAGYRGDKCALEAIFTLWMSKDGTAIDKVYQFVDSVSATRFCEEQQWVSRRSEERDPV
jgi:hypothetical protein